MKTLFLVGILVAIGWMAEGRSGGFGDGDFRQLASQAQSESDFERLAERCSENAHRFNKLKADAERELARIAGTSIPAGLPKWPTRAETLRSLVDRYANSAAQWSKLQADSLERAKSVKSVVRVAN